MKFNAYVILIYACLVLVGGTFGFVLKGSTPSLFMGTLFSLLLGCSAVSIYRGNPAAKKWALFFVAVLTIFFSYRFIKTASFMPGGFMALLSIFVLVALFLDLPRIKKS